MSAVGTGGQGARAMGARGQTASGAGLAPWVGLAGAGGRAVGNLHPDCPEEGSRRKQPGCGGSRSPGGNEVAASGCWEAPSTARRTVPRGDLRPAWYGCQGRPWWRRLVASQHGWRPLCLGFSLSIALLSFIRNASPCLRPVRFPSPLWSGAPRLPPKSHGTGRSAPALDLEPGGLPLSSESRRSQRWAWESEQGPCKRNSFLGASGFRV